MFKRDTTSYGEKNIFYLSFGATVYANLVVFYKNEITLRWNSHIYYILFTLYRYWINKLVGISSTFLQADDFEANMEFVSLYCRN